MAKVRNTKLVRELLHEFQEGSSAISVVDLVDRLRDKMNKTSVYRILKRMEDTNKLHSFIGQNGLRWYAKCDECCSSCQTYIIDHPHFQCRDCGKTECLPGTFAVPSFPNHKVESAHLLLIGQCMDCADD